MCHPSVWFQPFFCVHPCLVSQSALVYLVCVFHAVFVSLSVLLLCLPVVCFCFLFLASLLVATLLLDLEVLYGFLSLDWLLKACFCSWSCLPLECLAFGSSLFYVRAIVDLFHLFWLYSCSVSLNKQQCEFTLAPGNNYPHRMDLMGWSWWETRGTPADTYDSSSGSHSNLFEYRLFSYLIEFKCSQIKVFFN